MIIEKRIKLIISYKKYNTDNKIMSNKIISNKIMSNKIDKVNNWIKNEANNRK